VPGVGARLVVGAPARANSFRFQPQFPADGRRFLYFAMGVRRPGFMSPRSTVPRRPNNFSLTARLRGMRHGRRRGKRPSVFLRENAVMAQPFDPVRLTLTGPAYPVAILSGASLYPEYGALAVAS
jgi:hypothetical protein